MKAANDKRCYDNISNTVLIEGTGQSEITKKVPMCCCIFLLSVPAASAAGLDYGSVHYGLMHPNGVDVIGYSVEKRVTGHWYRFYTLGFPSLVAAGFSYYDEYQGNGLTNTLGIGIGSVVYGSIAYQYHTNRRQYLKIGVGLTTGIAYNGIYPVLAYENRF